MTFEDHVTKAYDRFSGMISNPSFSGNFIKNMLADWKAEREKAEARIKELEEGLRELRVEILTDPTQYPIARRLLEEKPGGKSCKNNIMTG